MDHPTRHLDRPEENEDPPDQETRHFDQPLPVSPTGTPTRRLGALPSLPSEAETPHPASQFVDHRPLDQRSPTPSLAPRSRRIPKPRDTTPASRADRIARVATNRKCLRCGQLMMKADLLGNTLRLVQHKSDSFWHGALNSEVKAAVCPDCGYTEFYATDPEDLIPTDPWIR